MYNCIHEYAPDHLVNSIVMACDINDVNTQNNYTMNTHIPYSSTDIWKKVIYASWICILWNDLTLDQFKRQAKLFFN